MNAPIYKQKPIGSVAGSIRRQLGIIFESRAEAEAQQIAASVNSFIVTEGDVVLFYSRDPSGTALETADGATWSPLGVPTPLHWAENTTPGTTDMTSAINAAIDFAAENAGTLISGKVDLVRAPAHLPSGLYKTSGPINVKEGVEFFGDGKSSSVILPSHVGVGVEMGGDDREYANVVVRDLAVFGAYTGTLTYGNWTPSLTEGIRARNCLRACGIRDTLVARCAVNYRVDNSYQFALERNYGAYATLNNVRGNNFTASRITGNRFDWAEQDGIYIDGGEETIGLVIEANAIQICWRNGILLYDTQSVKVEGNFFEANYRLASSGSTHDYADVNITSGPNSRGHTFAVNENFFTSGSSPDFDAYTAIRCDRAEILTVSGNVCRDSFYWRFVDANNANVKVLDIHGNGPTATVANRVNYASATAKGAVADGSDGLGVWRFIDLIGSRLRLGASLTGSNFSTTDRSSDYYINCSAGARTLTLRDEECLPGALIRAFKTDGGSNNLVIAVPGGSTKTINGASSASKAGAYASFSVGSDGNNWFFLT